MKLMPQFQAQVPHPLRDHLPALLPPGGVAAPPIGVLFGVLIGESRLKGAAMQIQLDDIGGGEDLRRQSREEEFIDDAFPRDANWTLFVAGGMGGHYHATEHARRSHRHLWTVVEAAHQLAFRTLLKLIWGEAQTRLHERMIEHGVLFAAHHEREACQIRQHGPGAVLPIEPEEGALLRKLVGSEVATDGREGLTKFLPVESVASVAKRAEPLVGVGLADDGTSPHDFPTLAPRIA